MIVTGAKLEEIGRALFGPRWKSPLAAELGKDERTVRRYVEGEAKVGRGLRQRLAVVCWTRSGLLRRIALELDPNVAENVRLSGH